MKRSEKREEMKGRKRGNERKGRVKEREGLKKRKQLILREKKGEET